MLVTEIRESLEQAHEALKLAERNDYYLEQHPEDFTTHTQRLHQYHTIRGRCYSAALKHLNVTELRLRKLHLCRRVNDDFCVYTKPRC